MHDILEPHRNDDSPPIGASRMSGSEPASGENKGWTSVWPDAPAGSWGCRALLASPGVPL